ncbi:MAG: hypothetical protein JW723_07940 [Bacteroidales bacterium]|nr:hypothetical protein [Bacteroidales bacterium]
MKHTFLAVGLIIFISTNLLPQQPASKIARSSKTAKITDEINISEGDVGIFKETTEKKVAEFQQHIVIIADKDQPQEKRNLAEREALKLFYKGALMEVSFLTEEGEAEIRTRTMENYLFRLKTLPYTRVVIKYYDIAYITDFIKGPDSRYYAVATIFQEFTGFVGDNIAYTDVTQKEIEIVVEQVEDKFYNEKRWKIFLGNIKATETKSELVSSL